MDILFARKNSQISIGIGKIFIVEMNCIWKKIEILIKLAMLAMTQLSFLFQLESLWKHLLHQHMSHVSSTKHPVKRFLHSCKYCKSYGNIFKWQKWWQIHRSEKMKKSIKNKKIINMSDSDC